MQALESNENTSWQLCMNNYELCTILMHLVLKKKKVCTNALNLLHNKNAKESCRAKLDNGNGVVSVIFVCTARSMEGGRQWVPTGLKWTPKVFLLPRLVSLSGRRRGLRKRGHSFPCLVLSLVGWIWRITKGQSKSAPPKDRHTFQLEQRTKEENTLSLFLKKKGL